jgi:hypothetical protein
VLPSVIPFDVDSSGRTPPDAVCRCVHPKSGLLLLGFDGQPGGSGQASRLADVCAARSRILHQRMPTSRSSGTLAARDRVCIQNFLTARNPPSTRMSSPVM